jgi:hypothetical protein
MTATSEFLPFATATGANVESQADYATALTTAEGFSAGLASSAKFNKAMRQATFVAAALANWISVEANVAVLDDGDLAGFTSKITAALEVFIGGQGYLTTTDAAAEYAPLSAFTGAEAALGYMQVFGFILQWGFLPALTNQSINTMNFTVAFPGNPFVMIATPGTSLALGSNAVGMGAAPISKTQGQIAVPSASPGTTGAYWFAIGNKG